MMDELPIRGLTLAFGIRVPGIRISTRGVRIGPRMANVRVGRRGVGASVGPRFARASVGSRGVTVGSGIGPVRVSNRGVQLSGGIGPVRASAGTDRASAEAGLGPFWLGASGRKRRYRSTASRTRSQSHTSEVRNLYGDSRARPKAANSYSDYRAGLAAAGVQRRNKFEIHDAAMQAWMMDLAPLVDLARPYPKAQKPAIPALPDKHEIRKSAVTDLRDAGALSWWPPRRNEAIMCRVAEIRGELRFESVVLKALVEEAFTRFDNLDPAMNLIVLQASFADNAGTAAPIDLDGDHLLVLMSYPLVEDAVWPEVGVFEGDRFTVKKRTKKQTVERYQRNLMCHAAATAKEAFCVQPCLGTVSVVVVPERPGGRLADLPVILGAKFQREEMLRAATISDTSWVRTWDSGLETWDSPDDNDYDESGGVVEGFIEGFSGVSQQGPDPRQAAWESRAGAAARAVSSFLAHSAGIQKTANDTINELDDTWMFRISNKAGFKSVGVLGDLVPADELDAADGNASAESVASPIDTPAHSPEAVYDCLFWTEALEMAEAWTNKQADSGNSKAGGTQPPPESPDGFWDPFVERLKRL